MWQLTKLTYSYSPYAISMPLIHPLNEIHVIAYLLKDLILSIFHVYDLAPYVESNSWIHHTFTSIAKVLFCCGKNMLCGTDLHLNAGSATASTCWTQCQKVCPGLVQSKSCQQNLWRSNCYSWGRREIHVGFLLENLK